MDTIEFMNLLRREGGYETPDASRSLRRLCGRLDAWFYLRSIGITFRTGLVARLGLLDDDRWAVSSHQTLTLFEECGARVRISGVEHIAGRTTPCVYVSNHMSMAETYLLPCVLLAGGSLTTVVKKSLLSYPGMGTILRNLDAIGVTRESPRDDLKTVLAEGRKRLDRGVSVLIFPQSTRTAYFDARLFNSIGAKLAHRAGVDLVPVAVKTDFQGVGRVIRDFGPLNRKQDVCLQVLPAIDVQKVGEKEAHAESVRQVSAALKAWGVDVRLSGNDGMQAAV